jgi:hypothetical protein
MTGTAILLSLSLFVQSGAAQNAITKTPNDFIILRDPGAVLIQQDFARLILDVMAAEKAKPDKGGAEFLRAHSERLSKLKSTAQIQEKNLDKDHAVETLLPGLVKPDNFPANGYAKLGACSSEWHNLMVIQVMYGQILTELANTGDSRYFSLLMSTVEKVGKAGPVANLPACKTW